jgi:hypothetical protein
MTLTFHLYQDGIEVLPAPLYAHDLANYKNGRISAAKQLKAFRSRKLNASILYSLNSLFGRMTIPNSTISALLSFSLFALLHSVYD